MMFTSIRRSRVAAVLSAVAFQVLTILPAQAQMFPEPGTPKPPGLENQQIYQDCQARLEECIDRAEFFAEQCAGECPSYPLAAHASCLIECDAAMDSRIARCVGLRNGLLDDAIDACFQ